MYPTKSRKYLIVGDQFLWFVTMMNHYLINPNQVRAFNITAHDNTFDATFFGIETDKSFRPFTSKGGVIVFELQVPILWEDHNLPVVFLKG